MSTIIDRLRKVGRCAYLDEDRETLAEAITEMGKMSVENDNKQIVIDALVRQVAEMNADITAYELFRDCILNWCEQTHSDIVSIFDVPDEIWNRVMP